MLQGNFYACDRDTDRDTDSVRDGHVLHMHCWAHALAIARPQFNSFVVGIDIESSDAEAAKDFARS